MEREAVARKRWLNGHGVYNSRVTVRWKDAFADIKTAGLADGHKRYRV